MIDAELAASAATLLESCRHKGWRIATAESCTGGLIAAALTEIAGSSDVVEGGVVSYSNAAKSNLLGVPAELIAEMGAVSAEVARAMAAGALACFPAATIAIAVTGVAGPGGGTAAKPVGLVQFALAVRHGKTRGWSRLFPGDRAVVRSATVACALAEMTALVSARE